MFHILEQIEHYSSKNGAFYEPELQELQQQEVVSLNFLADKV